MQKHRVKSKTKSKLKTKSKTKKTFKKKLTTKTKSKIKPQSKRKLKKTSLAPKTKSKAKTKKQSNTKTKTKAKATHASAYKPKFTTTQKSTLLEKIKKIVALRKNTVNGLRSLDAIDRILDPYNQKHTDTDGKFDAIISYAMIEYANYIADNGLIALKDTGRDSTELYALLAKIGEDKTQFADVNDKMNDIYENSLKEKHSK